MQIANIRFKFPHSHRPNFHRFAFSSLLLFLFSIVDRYIWHWAVGLTLWLVQAMTKLVPRYSEYELETLRLCIFPEERRSQFTREPWSGTGFRHYLDPKIVCIEHYLPKDIGALLPGRSLRLEP